MINDPNNQVLQQKIIVAAKNPSFIHHKWFVEYHLKIVEKIATELCKFYPAADQDYVMTLLWLHDYEKIIDFDNQFNTDLRATKELMAEVGYSKAEINDMCKSINQYNAKTNLDSSRIEIQIVSSSDAASHLVGPFMTLYWYENSNKSIEQLQADLIKKLQTDWEIKITLPEVKTAFEARYNFLLEVTGRLPVSYF